MQQHDIVQRMAGMSLGQPQPHGPQQQQQQQQQAQQPPQRTSNGNGSSSPALAIGAGPTRSEGRASARIARSHRAGGAYNPAEVGWVGWGACSQLAPSMQWWWDLSGQPPCLFCTSMRAPPLLPSPQFEFDLQEAESGRPDARRTIMVRGGRGRGRAPCFCGLALR
jgi:hypothetical protein